MIELRNGLMDPHCCSGLWNNYARLANKRWCSKLWLDGNEIKVEMSEQTSQVGARPMH
jgi:hypothetical protein